MVCANVTADTELAAPNDWFIVREPGALLRKPGIIDLFALNVRALQSGDVGFCSMISRVKTRTRTARSVMTACAYRTGLPDGRGARVLSRDGAHAHRERVQASALACVPERRRADHRLTVAVAFRRDESLVRSIRAATDARSQELVVRIGFLRIEVAPYGTVTAVAVRA